MTSTIAGVQSHLDAILRCLRPQMEFVNCHMVGYLTEQFWQTHVPDAIRRDVQTVADVEEAVQTFWAYHKHPEQYDDECTPSDTRFGGLIEFMRKSRQCQLGNLRGGVALGADELDAELRRRGLPTFRADGGGLQIKDFMSEKKNHEVEIAAQLVASLCSSETGDASSYSVIDAGDGKGYLSSRLALEHQLTILGIDANEGNTQGALKRSAQLQRAWTGLTKRAEDVKNGLTPPRKGRRSRQSPPDAATALETAQTAQIIANYQRSTHFITPKTDFLHLFRHHFPEGRRPTGFCLSGLHTCGPLASSCLQIFATNKTIRTLCNVGCCYHMLGEQFAPNDHYMDRNRPDDAEEPTTNDDAGLGFPMSAYLQQRQCGLGRNARMLASQSLDRTVHTQELPGRSLFYRALLEVLVNDDGAANGKRVQVGRMKRVDEMTFGEYVLKCKARHASLPVSEAMVAERLAAGLLEEYEFQRRCMDLFYLLRMTWAPVLETVILLDRLLFLKESGGVSAAFLVRLFDPVVSPRSVAVVAFKE